MLFLAIAGFANAQKGYSGFIELGYNMNVMKKIDPHIYDKGESIKLCDDFFNFKTIHGYSFNPHFFLGAGIGYGQTSFLRYVWTLDDDQMYMEKRKSTTPLFPVFVNLKATLLKKSISPFLTLNGGYTFDTFELIVLNDPDVPNMYTGKNEWFIQTSVGVDFKVNENLKLYYLMGFHLQQYQYVHYKGFSHENAYGSIPMKRDNPIIWLKSLDVKLGIQF